jgi:ribonucleoside-diphosphate reductase alpha chain
MHHNHDDDEPEYESEEVVSERVIEPKPVSKAFANPRSEHLHPLLENGNGKHAPAGTAVLMNDRIRLARLKGYEGDPCGECGQLTLVRNGSCCKCDSCGATSGCS